jgi:hypothetical protein
MSFVFGLQRAKLGRISGFDLGTMFGILRSRKISNYETTPEQRKIRRSIPIYSDMLRVNSVNQ